MPKFKLSGAKAVEQKSGFEPYDGPTPSRKGFYRGVIKSMKHGANSSGSEGFSIVVELEAAPGDPKGHAQFDGYPMFARNIITSSSDGGALKEGAVRNLNNLLAALGTKDEPDVILADGDGDKVDVKKIGGINPIGRVVNIDMDFELYEGDRRPTVGGIYKYKEIDAEPTGNGRAAILDEADDEDDEADLMESEEAEGDEEADEYDARAEELAGLGIPALKKIAKELDVAVSGTKDKLIERILEAEFAEEDDEPEDADEADADEPDEDEAEDDDEADDEADDEDDEEEEDDEDEDEAAKAERIAELADLDRAALKKILKEIASDFTVLKRHTEDQLREQIVAVEFDDDLPF